MHPESVHQAPALRQEAEPACGDRAHAERLAACGASFIKAVGDLCGAIEDQADGGIQFPPTALQASHRVTTSMEAMGQAIRDFRNASVVAMHPVAFAYRYPDGRNCTLGWNEPGEDERMALFTERRPLLRTPLYEHVGSCVGPSSRRDEVRGTDGHREQVGPIADHEPADRPGAAATTASESLDLTTSGRPGANTTANGCWLRCTTKTCDYPFCVTERTSVA